MPAMAALGTHASLGFATTWVPEPVPSASPRRKMLQRSTRRIEVGYCQHSALFALAHKHTGIRRIVFDKPTLGSMLGHSAQECTLQVTPRRKQINGERTSTRNRYDEPPRLPAWYKRIQLTSPASHGSR